MLEQVNTHHTFLSLLSVNPSQPWYLDLFFLLSVKSAIQLIHYFFGKEVEKKHGMCVLFSTLLFKTKQQKA